jgi:hypothetical protein
MTTAPRIARRINATAPGTAPKTRETHRRSAGTPGVLTVDQAISDAGLHRRPGQACAGYKCSRPTTGNDAVCRFHAGLQDGGAIPVVWDTSDPGSGSREER